MTVTQAPWHTLSMALAPSLRNPIKKFPAFFFNLALAYLAAELAAFLFFLVAEMRPIPLGEIRERQLQASRAGTVKRRSVAGVAVDQMPTDMPRTIHPFLGFNPPPPFTESDAKLHGLPGSPRVIAITGGSVALSLYHSSRPLIKRELAKHPCCRGRRFHIISLANSAWRQPQQVSAVAYYLFLGGKLDVLVNLDGHNEVFESYFVFPGGNAPPLGYPYLWKEAAAHSISPQQQLLIGKIALARSARSILARAGLELRFSITAQTLWHYGDRLFSAALARLRHQRAEISASEISYRPKGLERAIDDPDERLAEAVRQWKRGSLLLGSLARASGAQYFHFLQPNQYVRDSKKFSEEELRYATSTPLEGVVKGYPLLRAKGRELSAEGIDFSDLTGIFREHEATMYSDSWCHLSPAGKEVLAKEIARIIGDGIILRKGDATNKKKR